jgi:hypothetical protein
VLVVCAVGPVSCVTLMGVVLCLTLDANIIKFELMILSGKNHTGFITAVWTLKGAATWT